MLSRVRKLFEKVRFRWAITGIRKLGPELKLARDRGFKHAAKIITEGKKAGITFDYDDVVIVLNAYAGSIYRGWRGSLMKITKDDLMLFAEFIHGVELNGSTIGDIDIEETCSLSKLANGNRLQRLSDNDRKKLSDIAITIVGLHKSGSRVTLRDQINLMAKVFKVRVFMETIVFVWIEISKIGWPTNKVN